MLQKEEKTSNDLNFIDHYVTTYMPELSKRLKSKYQKEACDKVGLNTTP